MDKERYKKISGFFYLNVGHIDEVTRCAFLLAYCVTVNVHFKRESQILKKKITQY